MSDNFKDAFNDIKADKELKDNTYAYIKNEINKRENIKVNTFKYKYTITAVAAMFLAVVGLSGWKYYFTPVSFISVDINPSIEITLNAMDKVIDAKAYNDDGEKILNQISVNNLSYKDAIETLLSDTGFNEYINEESLLSFTVISPREEKIVQEIEARTDKYNIKSTCIRAGKEIMSEAHNQGMSFGKYGAYLKLKECDPNITTGECNGMSMGEINRIINNHSNKVCDIDGNRQNSSQQYNSSSTDDHSVENNNQNRNRKGAKNK